MNALAWILATSGVAAGVDYGWQTTPGGETEYVIQIEPSLVDALLAGEEITSEIPPELAGVRKFRIRVGSGPVRRDPLAAHTGHGNLLRNGSPAGAHPAPQLTLPVRDRGGQTFPPTAEGSQPAKAGSVPDPWGKNPGIDTPAGQADRAAAARGGIAPPAMPQVSPPSIDGVEGDPSDPNRVRIPPELPQIEQPREAGGFGQPPAKAAVDDRGGRFRRPARATLSDGNRNPAGPDLVPPSPDYLRDQPQVLPPRPSVPGPDLSSRFPTSPPVSVANDRFGAAIGAPREPAASPAAAARTWPGTPGATNPPVDPRDRSLFPPTSRNSLSVAPHTLTTPGSLQAASFDEPAAGGAAAVQMDKPTLPESAAQPPYKPWGWLIVTLLALFASASANLYLGWIAVDLHHRYRSAVMQLTDAAALGV